MSVVSTTDKIGWMGDDRNEADRILGEDWMDPRHALLVKALRRTRTWPHRATATGDGRARRSAAGRSAARSRTTAGSRCGPSLAARPVGRAASDQGRCMAREGGRA